MNYFEKKLNEYNSKVQELTKLGEDIKLLSDKFLNQDIVDKLIKEDLSTFIYIKGYYGSKITEIELFIVYDKTYKYDSDTIKSIEPAFAAPPFPTQTKFLTDFGLGEENSHLFYCVNPVEILPEQYPWDKECRFIEVGKFYNIYLSKNNHSGKHSGKLQISFKEFCNNHYITYTISNPSLINNSFITIEDYKKLEKFKFEHNGLKEVEERIKSAIDEILVLQKIKNPQINYLVTIENCSVKDKETCKKIFANHAEPVKRSDFDPERVQHYSTGRKKK